MAQPVMTRGGYPLSEADLVGLAHLGRVLREGRRQRGLTQWQLARAIDVHQSTISRLEQGQLTNFSLVKLGRLILALGGSATVAFGRR